MMQLAIVLFLMLLCGTFGKVVVNNDLNATTIGIKNLMPSLIPDPCPSAQSVSIYLFTSDNLQGQLVNVNQSCTLFDQSKRVIFLSHGFIATPYNYNLSDLAAGLAQENTVFSLDWSHAACWDVPTQLLQLSCYPCAANNTREVGNHLASIAKSLIDVCGIPLNNITFMGHSLGAHVVSFACKNLYNSSYGRCPLLFGIEPAAPLFMGKSCADRFCITDAERVEASHTSLLGLQKSVAHYDLWYNNGVGQPACGSITNNTILNDMELIQLLVSDVNVNCSHNIAIIYQIIIVKNNTYVGHPIPPRSLPDFIPGCSSDTTNCIAVDKRIFNATYAQTGNCCVSVTSTSPYYTTTNSTCQ